MRKILLAVAAALPSLALASGYTLPNTNPRDLSLSASAVAAQRDSGAAFALPAALARLEGPYVSVGLGVVNVFDDWTDPTPGATPARLGDPAEPGSENLDLQFTIFPNISVAYGGKLAALGDRRWGVGLGLQPFGGAVVRWPDDWAGRYRIVEVDRQVFSGILSAGIEVLPQVRVGGGLMYYYTMQKLTQKAWMQPYPFTSPTGGAPDATGELDLSGGALTYSVSVEIEPLKDIPLMIGVDYKHKATQELDGDVEWTGTEPYLSSPAIAQVPELTQLFTATKAEQQLTIPNLLNVGVAYRVAKPLLLTGTFTFDRWVVYDRDRFVADTGAVIQVKRNYGNGQTYRVGAEWDVGPALQLRAGIQRDVSGLDERYYSPTLPDASSWGGSLGFTYRLPRGFSVDAAVFYANMDEVEAENAGAEPGTPTPPGSPSPVFLFPQENTSFRGSYEPSALVYGVAVAWKPGAR